MGDPTIQPQRRSPFAALAASGDLQETAGGKNDDHPIGVVLTPRTGLSLLQIDCHLDRLAEFDLPVPAVGAALSVDGIRMLALGPARWMAVSRHAAALDERVRPAAERAGAAVVDQSHGRAILRVTGAHARDTLAKGTEIDLHDRAFPCDQVRQTGLFHVAVAIDRRRGPTTFDIHMPRGYAQAIAERLIEAAREYV